MVLSAIAECVAITAVRRRVRCCAGRKYLEMDINIPEDMARQYGDIVAKHLTIVADRYRRLFFVDNIINTLKVFSTFLCITRSAL